MSTATLVMLQRARSSSFIVTPTLRSIASISSPGSGCHLQQTRSSDTAGGSSRAISTLLHRQYLQGSRSTPYSTFRAHQISTSASLQKSALPLSAIDNDDDNDDDIDTSLPPATAPSNTNTNSTPFLLADIGEGISEVELLQWFVSPGDTVAQFDRICEVQSDKASVEITSRFDGVIETLCGGVGDMMFVGKPLLYIATEGGVGGGRAEQQQQTQSQEAAVAQQQQAATLNNVDDEKDRLHIPSAGTNYSSHYDETAGGSSRTASAKDDTSMNKKVLTSPAVRKLSKENHIDLGSVLGTGPRGRILKADILKLINATSGARKSCAAVAATSSSSTSSIGSATTSSLISSSPLEEDAVIPIRGYNRLMVKAMITSLQIPHMVYADEINVNALTNVRNDLRPLANELGVPKLTYLPFFIKAASLAMRKYPVLNSTIDVEEMTLTYHAEHNIGVAVDTERGLAVPVVRNCESRSVLEIAVELNRVYTLVSIFVMTFFLY